MYSTVKCIELVLLSKKAVLYYQKWEWDLSRSRNKNNYSGTQLTGSSPKMCHTLIYFFRFSQTIGAKKSKIDILIDFGFFLVVVELNQS